MTHVLDSSGALAVLLREPGEERVKAILADPAHGVGIAALTLFEVDAAVFHRTGSHQAADRAVEGLRRAVAEVVLVTEEILELARELRWVATARIATVDVLIAATAALLVHRDPHFAALPLGRPDQEALPDKA